MKPDEIIERDDNKPIEGLATDELEGIVTRTWASLEGWKRELAKGVGGEAARPFFESVVKEVGEIYEAQKRLLERQKQKELG